MPKLFTRQPNPTSTNPVCSPLLAVVGRQRIVKSTIREGRKLLRANDTCGLRRASDRSKVILALVLFVSSYCIDLAHAGQVSPSSINGVGKGISASSSAGKDGGGGGKGVDDGESSSPHHHNHHHSYSSGNRHHRHGSSTSSKSSPYSSSVYPSTSAAHGYQQEFSPLSYYPEAYYEPRYQERPSSEFSARSTSYPASAMAAAASSQVGFTDTEFGGLALATGHGGGHGGGGGGHHDGGHGHGHGHGHHTTYYKTVNKLDQSSLGLLGLLGLLSLLSNVLMLLTTTSGMMTMATDPPPMLRLKRDTMMLVNLKDDGDSSKPSNVFERLTRLILPSLNVVGHAKDGRIPVNCTYQEVCKTNKVLVQVFGVDEGRPVASVMSTAIAKLLMDNNKAKRKSEARIVKGRHYQGIKGASALMERLLTEAGKAGRNGADCEVAYPTCKALNDEDGNGESESNGIAKIYGGGSFKLPLLVSPERALAIIMGQRDTH